MGTDIKQFPSDIGDALSYDDKSPSCLRWKIRPSKWSRISPGDVAGCLDALGYWVVKYKGSLYKAHRIVLHLNGIELPEDMVVDHIDRDRSNNLFQNLRVISWKANAHNLNKKQHNLSGTTGVCKQKGKGDYWSWVASCRLPCGKYLRKTFGIRKYGDEVAKQMAEDARKEMLTYLNTQGAFYTENHGK